jgi:hypothetical protein
MNFHVNLISNEFSRQNIISNESSRQNIISNELSLGIWGYKIN